MIKILALILFILIIYLVSFFWSKSNIIYKKKIAMIVGTVIFSITAIIFYLVIN